MRDPYVSLGVDRNADAEDIKRVYRRIVRECHPDRNPSPAAEVRFREVSEAYAVLSDPEARALFDEFGAMSLQPGFDPVLARRAHAPAGATGPTSSPFGDLSAFADVMGAAFAEDPPPADPWDTGRRSETRARPAEAWERGPTQGRARAPDPRESDDTYGNGWGQRGGPLPPPGFPEDLFGGRAQGGYTDTPRPDARTRRGGDERAQATISPLIAFVGGVATVEVLRAGGRAEQVRLRVRAGARSGDTVVLPGQANAGRGAVPGDLTVELQVPEHPHLRRIGDDLEMDVPVTLLEAVQGGPITVPTPTGFARVQLPPNCSGQKLRLRGRGVQNPDGAGHLVLHIRPVLPDPIDATVLEACRAIERSYRDDVRSRIRL